MPDPKPYPERPEIPKRPKKTEEVRPEWQSFTALPPPAPKLGFPEKDPVRQTPPRSAPQSTPQNTSVGSGVKLATWQKRLGSFALDFGLGLGASYLAQGVMALFGAGAETVDLTGYTVFFAAWLINRGYFQSRPEGQSFGKWLLNIKVIDTETDQSPSLIRSVAREGVTSLFILTETLAVPLIADGIFAIFDQQKRQSIHDRAGRTQVIEAEEGFELDQKAVQFLEQVLEGDAMDEVKAVAGDLLKQAKKNEMISDLSDQVGRLTKDIERNTRGARKQTRQQMKTWVETAKKNLDNE